MNNKVKISIAIVLVILVIIICVVTFSKKEGNTDEVNSNTVENITNMLEENTVKNEAIENKVENTTVKEPSEGDEKLNTEDFSTSVYESSSEVGTTNKKQEAIDLVKKQWGEDDSVTFSCDSVTSDGIYVIAVISKERAVVVNYFRVDLKDKSVEIDY